MKPLTDADRRDYQFYQRHPDLAVGVTGTLLGGMTQLVGSPQVLATHPALTSGAVLGAMAYAAQAENRIRQDEGAPLPPGAPAWIALGALPALATAALQPRPLPQRLKGMAYSAGAAAMGIKVLDTLARIQHYRRLGSQIEKEAMHKRAFTANQSPVTDEHVSALMPYFEHHVRASQRASTHPNDQNAVQADEYATHAYASKLREVSLTGPDLQILTDHMNAHHWDRVASGRVKKADAAFEYIAEVNLPGGHFPSHKLEVDYHMKHPILNTFHPMTLGGAAAGAMVGHALSRRFHVPHPVAWGSGLGIVAGQVGEAAHRYQYLRAIKQRIDDGLVPELQYEI